MSYYEEKMVLINQGLECGSGYLRAPAEDDTACATCANAIYTVEKSPEISQQVKQAQQQALLHEVETRRRFSIPVTERLEDHRNFEQGYFYDYEEAIKIAKSLRDDEIFRAARFKCELNCAANPVVLCNRYKDSE
jgi:hypothetical protein